MSTSRPNSAQCSYLDQGLMVTPYSELRPCCRFDTSKYRESFIWDGTNSIESLFHGPLFNQLRQQAQKGEAVAGCHRCYREEELGIQSMRQKPAIKGLPASDLQAPKVTTMELAVGRICNLKCRSCDSFFSTKWDSDARALHYKVPNLNVQINLDLITNDFMSEVRTLKITGGEPCLDVPFHRLLQRLVDGGLAPQIEIEVFSNTTVTPPLLMTQALAHFKKVQISLSVDAVGEQNSYLRHPSDWNKVVQTTAQWLELRDRNSHWTVGFAATVSVFNILSLFELLKWFLSLKTEHPLDVVFQVVHDPIYLSVADLPPSKRREIYIQFKKQWDEFKKTEPRSTRYESKIKKVEKLFTESVHGGQHLEQFWTQTQSLDQLRSEKFANTFPVVHQILASNEVVL